jgi:polyhydroxyalkanoate synthesis repressor PhaR
MADQVILKKYGNRRLYDTDRSAYVTLDQVADMIRAGKEVCALDAKTKEDVTAFVLTQIVLEKARKKNALLPVPLLHMIIRYGDNILSEFFDSYLALLVRNYLAYKSKADEQFKKWLNFGMDLSEMAQRSVADLSPFQFFKPPSGVKDEKKEK